MTDLQPVGTFVVTADGVTHGLAELMSTPPEAGEDRGISIAELFPALEDAALEGWRRALASGSAHSLEVRIGGNGRAPTRHLVRTRPLTAPDAPPGLHVGVLSAPTHETGSGSDHYRMLVESSLGLVCAHDLEGRLIGINPTGAGLLGYRPDELIGAHLETLVAPAFRSEVAPYLERIRKFGSDRGMMRVLRRHGGQRLWSYANRQLDGPDGAWVVGHAQDVTELFLSRARLRRLAELDLTTGLPDRRSFLALLRPVVEEAQVGGTPATVLLLNPADFRSVNDRFGRKAGDQVLAEIGARIRAFRGAETAHYGGATFAGLVRVGLEEAVEIVGELRERLARQPYLDGALRLDFNFGLAEIGAAEAAASDPVDVLAQRAAWALRRAEADGSGQTIAPERVAEGVQAEVLSGIFTTDLALDYRNMLLMWNVLAVLSDQSEPRRIAAGVLDALIPTFHLTRALLVAWREGSEPDWLEEEPPPVAVREEDERLLEELARLRGRGGDVIEIEAPGDLRQVVVPLISHARRQGFLVLEGRSAAMRLAAADHQILERLAIHVASGLDRATLVERERRLQEEQSLSLEREVAELRDLLKRTQLVYRSKPMRRIVETAGRMAASDASVLVTGESGTGKEVIAQVIHALSPRRITEPVVVDLSAMTPSVIESELFGHVKGAFTGADTAAPGRLLQADGSTVILDEIGELPLPAQGKLLRFVQEKQIVPVGGHDVRTVDVRIVACTNRDLAGEVARGRFRQDLYYRLNVLRLHLPPLRDRLEDVSVLATHFLQRFATEHGRRCRLSAEALEALEAYPWPGNVRELQNCLLRAVVLSRSATIGPDDLGLAPAAERREADGADRTGHFVAQLRDAWNEPATGTADGRVTPKSGRLQEVLGRLLEAELESSPPLAPLGRWLAEDLHRAALAAADGNVSRGAELLDLPETTFRRRLSRLGTTPAERPEYWRSVHETLVAELGARGGPGSQFYAEAHDSFLRVLLEQLGDDPRRAASIAGVSLPTLRRRRRELG